MSRSVVYRENDSREWQREEQPKRTYTTVKRYQVPDTSARSTLNLGGDERAEEKIIIRREKSAQPLRNDDYDYRASDRQQQRDTKSRDDIDIRITERSREEAPRQEEDYRYSSQRYAEPQREPKRDVTYRVVERDRDVDYDDRRSSVRGDYRSDYKTSYRVETDRETIRAPSPPTQDRVREFRFERERDYSPPQPSHAHRRADSYEVERYSKDTEYYTQPAPAPQPIIIRESRPAPPIIIREREPQPIIIREERREPQYEFIERREVEEERSLVRREEPPPPASIHPSVHGSVHASVQQPPQQQEEDYFYERRVREIDRAPRREESRDRRSEIRPRDSASQYSSDDSYEYIRKERVVDDDRDSHHRRHLAEGALAGAAAGAIINHHRKAEGRDGGGKVKSAVGGAALGAIGTEVVSRFRSRSRRGGSQSRSRSGSRETKRDRRRGRRDRDRERSRSRSRSRSKSVSRKQLAGLAGVAAVGALAGYALNKRNKDKQETIVINEGKPHRRHKSRGRRGSSESSIVDDEMREDDRHRDPDHRNRRIAQAGLASAAAAGIWERVRSKSRGGKGKDRERSKSRVKTGVPIAAAGLGGAALAGLYEKNKASKEAKRDAIIADETSKHRRGRSRSRSRSVPASHADGRRRIDDRDMVAYGDEPVHPADRGYYSDEEPGVYRRRHRSGSSANSSPDNRKRSRSRGRNIAEAGAAAGVAAVAAHEIGKRGERKKNERSRSRQRRDDDYDDRYDDHDDRYDDRYDEQPSGFLPPQQPQQNYPTSTYFPPPPTTAAENAYAENQAYQHQQQPGATYPAYNPADYAAPGTVPQQQQYPYDASRGAYGDSEATLGAPYGHETYAGDNRYGGAPPPADDGRGRGRDPNNVSAPVNGESGERGVEDADGVTTPRARSTSRVRFNLDANEAHSPEMARKVPERASDSETKGERRSRRREGKRGKHRDREGGEHDDRREHRSGREHRSDRDHGRDRDGHRDSPQLMHDEYDRPPSGASRDDESDGTIEMPERFDKNGDPKGGDALETLLGSLASKFLGGGGGDGEEEGRSGRRRGRH